MRAAHCTEQKALRVSGFDPMRAFGSKKSGPQTAVEISVLSTRSVAQRAQALGTYAELWIARNPRMRQSRIEYPPRRLQKEKIQEYWLYFLQDPFDARSQIFI